MRLTCHGTAEGPRWALDGHYLSQSLSLASLLSLPDAAMRDLLGTAQTGEAASEPLLAPLEPLHEVWAAGVTYLRSREAREAESDVADVYTRVYHAQRPELFLKATGWRVAGPGIPIRVRRDSPWNVPEPELVLVINHQGEIVGYTAGNDVSSRAIEGANPLYLPQAKVYDGACALGPAIRLDTPDAMANLPIRLEIERAGLPVFEGETSTAQMKRSLDDLVAYLTRELSFPHGVFLMTGTGIVPPEGFTLQPGDRVRIAVGELRLENGVA